MKHTNGKWQIKKRDNSQMYDIVSPLHTKWQIAEAILERDVKLISKAPEMFEALKRASLHLDLCNCKHRADNRGQLVNEIDSLLKEIES